MAQERAQSLLVPQSGFFLPHPMHGMPTFTAYQTLPYGRSNHGTGIENRFQDIMGFTQTFTPFANPAHISNPSECGCDYQVVTYEELEKLLPDPKPTTRVELGILPDGSAYAPKTATRENYLLFPSKANYILYFTHHYFSKENLCRDQTFLGMLINRLVMPLEKLIKAPRLAAINTTLEDAEQALANSKIVCLEDLDGSVRGVRRIDGYPAVFDTEEPSIPRHSPPHHNLSVPDALCEDAHNVDHNAITATTTDPLMTVTSAISGSVPVSWLTSSVGHYTSDNVPSSAANISHNGRGMPAVWPPQHPPLLMGAYPRPTGHHVQYPEGHIGYGGQNAALFGNPPRSPFTSAGSSATVPQSYPPVHGGGPSLGNAGSYPSATLPFFQAQPAPSQVGLIMAAMQQNAPPNQTIAQANPQQVANQLFAAVAAAAHPNPFAAALAAAAQQQQQACYHHASTLHTNQLQRPAGPLLYYANQPLPLSLQRHSGRMPQATMYPNAQPYQGVHPTNLFPHQSSHSDLLGRLDIPPHGHSFSGGVPHTSNVHYPVLLSNPLQFPQGSANPGISDLTTGLSGLHIHYGRSRPSFSQPMGVNLAGNVPISVATTVPPTATVSDMPKFSSEPENNDASTDGYPTTDGSTGEDPSESAQSTVVYCNLTMTANNNDEGESGEAVATDHPAATSGQAVDDSEESTSSGIGEMNSGCSSNTGDIASRMPSTDGALNINVEPSLAASTTNTPEPDP